MIPGQTLPRGWCWTTLEEIASIQGGIQKQPKRAPKDNSFPFLRVANVMRGKLDLAEVHRIELFGAELNRLRLEAGDLLIVEGNGSPTEIGRLAIWDGSIQDCVHQNHIIRARLRDDVLPEYVAAYWNSTDGARALLDLASSTSGLYTLSVSKVSEFAIPLAPPAEQRRIVAEIESQFTRLDAAILALQRVLRRLSRHRRSAVLSLCARAINLDNSPRPLSAYADCLDARRVPVNRKAREQRVGPVPYYGANGRAGWIDSHIFDEALVLVVEDETFVGRQKPFAYRISGKSWVNNHAHVLRPREGVSAEFLALALAYYPFIPLTTGSTGRRKLTQAALMSAPLSIPHIDEQAKIVAETDKALSGGDTIATTVETNLKRAARLRQAILKRAFEGRLVPQDPNDEPAEVALQRIRTNGQPNLGRRAAVEGK